MKTHSASRRQAGVCLHITSLPGPYGIGEIGEHAKAFIDSMQAMQLAVWQFLPLGPTAFGDSPYQPLSTFAGNELLVDVNDLICNGFLEDSEAHALTLLPHDFVDYGALIATKLPLLRTAASRFDYNASASMKAEFDDFKQRHDQSWLHDYALFRTLKTQHGERPWPEWQPQFVHRESAALRDLEASNANSIAAIKIIQFLFYRQWQELRDYARAKDVQLFGDMPIYIALDSADAWANREILRIDDDGRPDCVAGVPPDYFSADGQLWGNPLYDWDYHRAQGFEWWIERLRAAMELTDLVRIDHFRGFEAYWAIPADAETARQGSWEPGPGDALFDAARAAFGELPIVAEDLGMITAEVEALRARHHMPGMKVLQFAITDEQFDLSDIEENCVCYTATHDNDTTVGWYTGDAEAIHTDLIQAAFSTDAYLAIAPLQDYLGLGSEARMNIPGTAENNWRWRFVATQLDDSVCNDVSKMVRASRRGRLVGSLSN
jgi:4-alpha-glucanotransferase